jgi:zinc transporter ZupT
MNNWLYILLFLAPFAGGLMSLFSGYKNERALKWFLAFAGGYLFSVTLLNILPELFKSNDGYAAYLLLSGFFFQLLISNFSEGAEHGHLHTHHHNHQMAIPLSLYVSMCIHSFAEGLPLGVVNTLHTPIGFGIALHEFPAAFALISILRTEHIKQSFVIFLLLAYASMSPLGALSGELIQTSSTGIFTGIIAFAGGIFLYISTTILFENSNNHRFSGAKLIAVLAGLFIALAGSWL